MYASVSVVMSMHYIHRKREREREICFIFIESIYSPIVFTASKAGIPDPKGCYIRHWKSNNQPPLPIQASPGYLESSQSVFLWLLSLTSLQSCRCRQYDSFQGCLVSFFCTNLRSCWRNWNANPSRCLLEPMVPLRQSMLLVFIVHINLRVVLCKTSLFT